jgi:general stress protein YciG
MNRSADNNKPATEGAAQEGQQAPRERRGGFAANPARAREAGSRGGSTVRERYGADYFKQIGARGGQKVRERLGRDYFVELGRKGGSSRGKDTNNAGGDGSGQ